MIVANMATYPARAAALREAVQRIAPQVDRLNVVLNEYDAVPEWLKEMPGVFALIPDEDLKDIGKFYPGVADSDVVILVDDDLLYPSDYVSHLVREATAAGLLSGRGGIGGLHGTIYTGFLDNLSIRVALRVLYHRAWRVGSFRRMLSYWDELAKPVQVEQIGTGTAILPGHLMPALPDMISGKRRADVQLAGWAHRNNVPIVALPRAQGWLKSNEQDDSIYAAYTRHMPAELSGEIKKFAGLIEGAGNQWEPEMPLVVGCGHAC